MKGPSLMQMLRTLVETPSVSSVHPHLDMGNGPVIESLAGWLNDLGFRVSVLPVGDTGKSNLLATLGTGEGGLVLAGHTDTVPWDEGAWQRDPFKLTEAGDRLYGLGIADMKAFLALAITAARDFDAAALHRPLTILATADEESGMHGARALTAADLETARHAVIGEPTGLRPVNMHKGIFMEAIRIQGRSGHSSDPALGASALEGMHAVMGRLMAWRRRLQREHRDTAFLVPVPTLNFGCIHGGDNPNRICARCELQIDLRPLPGMAIAELRENLREQVREALRDTDLQASFAALFDGVPGMLTDSNSAVVRAAVALTGEPAGAVAFGTEGPYLNRLGLETVILGPGDLAQAHQPDEFLHRDRLDKTADLLRSLIQQFCVDADKH